MNLGQRIYELRTQKNLSQGDLAEALDVSRQSISKWETGSSVPELDKLIKLSQLFGVTLDELILDKQPEAATPPPEPQIIYVERQEPRSTRKTAGVVLLCFSAFVWLLVSLLGDVLTGLVLASPFLACGLICLFVRRHVGLWCLWVVYAFADLYLRFATGVNINFVMNPRFYMGGHTIHLIVAWVNLAVFAALTTATVLRFRKGGPASVKANAIGAAISWIAYLLLPLVVATPSREPITDPDQIRLYRTAGALGGWLRTVVVVIALTFTVRLLTGLWQKRKARMAKT